MSNENSHQESATPLVNVSVIVRDSRGFAHYYEELEADPAVVRQAYDTMARTAPRSLTSAPDISLPLLSDHRRAQLNALVEHRPTPQDAIEALQGSESNIAQDAVVLRVKHVEAMVALFERGETDEATVITWATAIISAGDIALEARNDELLAQALFELSTPRLFGSMSEVVASLRARLLLAEG